MGILFFMEKFLTFFIFTQKILEKIFKNSGGRKNMKSFLKKLESENFRLRFLNFSEIDSWSTLDNYTRIKSFIVDGVFEIACSKWYLMYIQIVESLQKIRPLNINHLLSLSPFKGRCTPFLNHRAAGYSETSFGLFLRVPTAANDVILAIKKMLRIYGFDTRDAYLVVELNPDSASYYSDDIIKQEQNDLFMFLKNTFVEAEDYYNIAINAIDAMNETLQNLTTTTYNNLYLLSEGDYDRYSKEAIEKQLRRLNNTFTERELNLAVAWLRYARFYENDYICVGHKDCSGSFIKDGDKSIQVMFETHFFKREGE